MLFEQGRLRRYGVMPLVDEALLAKDLTARVVEVGNYLASGAIKLARSAHEKLTTFKGVHRNHLIGELAAFTLGDKKVGVGPLLAAFATGALETLGGKHHLNVWRALASSTPLEPGPLANLWKAEPPRPAPAPQEPPSDPEVMHVMGTLAYDGCDLAAIRRRAEAVVQKRRETEAQLDCEHAVARAAAAERERKMREAGLE